MLYAPVSCHTLPDIDRCVFCRTMYELMFLVADSSFFSGCVMPMLGCIYVCVTVNIVHKKLNMLANVELRFLSIRKNGAVNAQKRPAVTGSTCSANNVESFLSS